MTVGIKILSTSDKLTKGSWKKVLNLQAEFNV